MVLQVISDERWAVLEPWLTEVRPWAARPIHDLRRTIAAIVWRHDHGAEWRSLPWERGPWWRAAQTFIRWSKLGVWERLLRRVQERRGLARGMVFLDGTVIRAHHKAAGDRKEGRTREDRAAVQALGRARRLRHQGPRPRRCRRPRHRLSPPGIMDGSRSACRARPVARSRQFPCR